MKPPLKVKRKKMVTGSLRLVLLTRHRPNKSWMNILNESHIRLSIQQRVGLDKARKCRKMVG